MRVEGRVINRFYVHKQGITDIEKTMKIGGTGAKGSVCGVEGRGVPYASIGNGLRWERLLCPPEKKVLT